MAKVDLDSVEHNMSQAGIGQNEIDRVLGQLKQELEDAAALRAAQPKVEKHKYIIANTDVPAGTPVSEYPMVVVEAEDSVQPTSLVDGIKNAIATANLDCKKLVKTPVTSVFDGIERVPAKYFKAHQIKTVAKFVTQVVETDNKLT